VAREVRLAWLELDVQAELSIIAQTDLLGLNRTSLYYKSIPPSLEEVRLKHRIDEIYTLHPFFGYRRIAVIMNRENISIHPNTVRKYMQAMGIEAIYPGPNLSKRNLKHRTYPYLLKGLSITKPNQVWGIDITYVRMQRGWMYLFAIIDWYSRYIIDWQLEQSLEISFVIDTLKRALSMGKPEIINSDQGSHFTSPQYIELLKGSEVRISMDGKGRALDNIFTERFWRSYKYEEVYLHEYANPKETRAGVNRYMPFYNHYRPHQSLQYQTPGSIYTGKTLLIHN
jgi:putative transposase